MCMQKQKGKIPSIFYWLFFGLLLCTTVHAQLPRNLKITNFDGSTGFYSRMVRCFLKDDQGFIWIGTADGLYRYDGYTFRNYHKQPNDTNSLPDNNVLQLAAGKDGKIWMGLEKGGVSCFDPATGNFRNYPVRINGKRVSAVISMLLVDHANEVWVGLKQKGLWQLNTLTGTYTAYDKLTDPKQLMPDSKIFASTTISTAVEGDQGVLWLGTHYGLFRFTTTSKELEPIRSQPLQTTVFRDDDFISVALDGDLLWLGSWAGGLSRYDIKTGQWKNFKINQAEPKKYTTNIISGIRVHSPKELWISSNDRGLGIFNKQTEQFSFYADDPVHQNDIPSILCYEVATDKYNNIWLMHEWGLTRIQPRESKFHFTEVPVSKTDNQQFYYIRDLLEDEDHIYVATLLADGFHVKNKKTGIDRHFPVKLMPGEEPFLSVFKILKDSKGKVWVVSRDYIYQYDTKQEKLVMIDQPTSTQLQKGSNHYNNITEDAKGNIWITSRRSGVFCYHPETGKYTHYYHDPQNKQSLTSNTITAITADRYGRVWVGGPAGMLAFYDPETDKFSGYAFYSSKNNAEAGNTVTALLADRNGMLWAGSDEGLIQIDISKPTPTVVKIYSLQDGLRGDVVYTIQQDWNGTIWFTTNSSLCMVNQRTQRVNSLLLSNDVMKTVADGIYLTVNGNKLQVLTYSGYYSFDPVSLREKEKDSVITITSFRVKDKEYYYQQELKEQGRIRLGATENMFTFEFTVLDFSQSDNRQYAYMLEGFDKGWINAGSRRYASYTNIPGGNYVFKVKSLDTYGDVNSSVVSIPLHVNAPFYKAWWFILIVSVIIASLLYVFYRFRIEKEREILQLQTKAQTLEKEKTQVQYENLKQHLNPHFLFNSLTSLSSLIRINQKLAGEFLDGMSRIYRYILQSKDSELVPLKDEIRFIQTFISLQKTRFNEGLQVNLRIEEEYTHQKIVPVTLQNLIENAIKHNIVDEETPLVIELFVEDGYLLVRNNLQKKSFVDTSNKQGLDNLLSLYKYLSDRPMLIEEDTHYFTVKIPLI